MAVTAQYNSSDIMREIETNRERDKGDKGEKRRNKMVEVEQRK